MATSTTSPVSTGDLSSPMIASGTNSGVARDNGVVLGAYASAGNKTNSENTNFNVTGGGTVNISGGAEQIAQLSSRFTDALGNLSKSALDGSREQASGFAQSLRETFETAIASVKELSAAKQSEGLTTAMKFVIGLVLVLVVGTVLFSKRK